MDNNTLRTLLLGLKVHYANAEEVEKIIINCALVAATADAVGSAIPGIAIPATIVGCFGAVWAMYGLICAKLGIILKGHVLKLLARAALSNILMNLGGAMIASFAGMFIPGASIAVSAVVTFVTIYLAGWIFLQLIAKLADESSDPHSFSDIGEAKMKAVIKETKVSKDDLDAARAVYKENKKD